MVDEWDEWDVGTMGTGHHFLIGKPRVFPDSVHFWYSRSNFRGI